MMISLNPYRLKRLNKAIFLACAVCASTVFAQLTFSCTGIILHSLNNVTVPARTMEFSFDIKSNVLAFPAGTGIETLILNPEETGFAYKTKYGFVGANGLDMPIVFDGVNTEGLYFGAFYFSGDAVYETLTEDNRGRAISSDELGNWVLGQFATVEEVKAALPDISVVGTYVDVIDSFAPFHYSVVDATGAAIVIEYTEKGLQVYDNSVNVVTNNPTYDWHVTNLRNYIGLQSSNRTEIKVGSQRLAPFGQGSGMVGLPGDMSSPSRFVRAAAFVNASLDSANEAEAIFRAFHILNNFDIPIGAIRENNSEDALMGYTVWTSAVDTSNAIYYYKTFLTQAVESVSVRDVVKDLKEPKTLKMESGFAIKDRSGEFDS